MQQRSALTTGGSRSVGQVRLFPNVEQVGWRYRVHEQILPALQPAGVPAEATDIVIDHSCYQDPALARQKRLRNLDLLRRDGQDHPEDPFVLYNLGATLAEVAQPADGAGYLRRSLQLCSTATFRPPLDWLYSALVKALAQCGQAAEALELCRQGRAQAPDCAELLLLEACLRHRAGQLDRA